MSDEVRGDSSRGTAETENPNKNDDNEEVRENPNKNDDEKLQSDELQGVPDWFEEFKDNLVDESVPEHRDASSSFHELLSEPRAKVVSGKQSIFTHLPKDRNCDICLRTNNYKGFLQKTHWYSRAQSGTMLVIQQQRITKFSVKDVNLDTIIDTLQWYKTWQHSGYNHTHVKQKLLRKRKKSSQKFLEPTRKPKVTYTDNSQEFGKACEKLTWNHCSSTPHRSETNGIAQHFWSRPADVPSLILGLHGMLLLSAKHSISLV